MHRAWQRRIAIVLAVTGGLVGCKSPSATEGPMFHSAAPGASTNPVVKAWNSTTSSIASAFKPAPKPLPDATSLNSTGKLSAETHIATGRLLESRDQFAAAQIEYEKAAKLEPKNVIALVSLARLQDRQGKPDEAIATYQKAAKADPKSALVQNDLGLCYARKRDLPSAIATLNKAVEMEPKKANYRNNLATVLVEAGRAEEALKQLVAVHPPAAAHYNLAYLLNHRGQTQLAKHHLQQALQLDPSLPGAQQMLAQLGGGSMPQAEAPQQPQIAAAQSSRRTEPTIRPPVQPDMSAAPAGSLEPAITAPDASQPADVGEPVHHIGSEGIEESAVGEGPSLYQPFQESSTGAPVGTMGYDQEDGAAEEVMVATHLVYGQDQDPAPQPFDLVDHEIEGGQEPAVEPMLVQPVSEPPTLYPIVE